MPQFVPLEREGVWLRTEGPSQWGNRGGNCEVLAPVARGTDIALVERALEQKFGTPGLVERPKTDQTKSWRIGGRYFSARIISGDLQLFMAFPEPTAEQQAAAAKAEAEQKARDLADRKAAIIPAPAIDFGAAATACVAAVGPAGLELARLGSLGWQAIPLNAPAGTKYFAYQHQGNAVRIFLSTEIAPKGQCVAEGNNPSKGAFGPIAGEVKTQVGAALGKKLKGTGSYSDQTGYSRGEGYLVDDLAIMMSSENRPEAMNVRVTVMRLDPSKSRESFANAAGMAAAMLPGVITRMIAGTTPTSPSQTTPNQ